MLFRSQESCCLRSTASFSKRNPVVLGDGVRLFGAAGAVVQNFDLVSCRSFESGVVIEEYVVLPGPPSELKPMVNNELVPLLSTGQKLYSRVHEGISQEPRTLINIF